MVDNTEYPYFGKFKPPFEVRTHKQQGTRKARLFQGMGLYGCGMMLVCEFRLLRYKQYRAKHIGLSAKWLKFQGFNLSYALMDGKFNRASLIKEFKDLKDKIEREIKDCKRENVWFLQKEKRRLYFAR